MCPKNVQKLAQKLNDSGFVHTPNGLKPDEAASRTEKLHRMLLL